MRYVTYEMNGMNANQQNTSQRGLCQPGTGPNVLFLAALSKSSLLSVHVELHCTHTHTHTVTYVNAHKYTPRTRLQLFNYCHHCLSLSTPFIALKGLFQQGSFQVLSHSFKCKRTSKNPQILNLHLFPPSEGFSLPSAI